MDNHENFKSIDWIHASNRDDISWDFVATHQGPTWKWNWDALSRKPNVPIEIALDHPEVSWKNIEQSVYEALLLRGVCIHPIDYSNVSIEFIMENKNLRRAPYKSWDWYSITHRVPTKFISENPQFDWNLDAIHAGWEFIRDHINWPWKCIDGSVAPREFVRENMHLNWSLPTITKHFSTAEIIGMIKHRVVSGDGFKTVVGLDVSFGGNDSYKLLCDAVGVKFLAMRSSDSWDMNDLYSREDLPYKFLLGTNPDSTMGYAIANNRGFTTTQLLCTPNMYINKGLRIDWRVVFARPDIEMPPEDCGEWTIITRRAIHYAPTFCTTHPDWHWDQDLLGYV